MHMHILLSTGTVLYYFLYMCVCICNAYSIPAKLYAYADTISSVIVDYLVYRYDELMICLKRMIVFIMGLINRYPQ